MAKRKRKTTRRKALSSGGSRTVAKRRSPRRKKGFLNDMFNPTTAMNSAKSTLAASAGAAGAVFVNKMIPATTSKLLRVGIALGVGFLGQNFGMANTGAGFTGGMMALTFQNGFLNDDDANYASGDALSDMPLYLDENGEAMVLEEGGSFRYLNDDEVHSLAEAGVIELEDDEDY